MYERRRAKDAIIFITHWYTQTHADYRREVMVVARVMNVIIIARLLAALEKLNPMHFCVCVQNMRMHAHEFNLNLKKMNQFIRRRHIYFMEEEDVLIVQYIYMHVRISRNFMRK